MKGEEQGVLVEIPEQPANESVKGAGGGSPKLKPIDRQQGLLRTVIVEELVPENHKVRAIWELTGHWDLSGFLKKIKSQEGQSGRAAWDPRLLLSVWLYAYSEHVTSARKIEALMEYEPGLMWLAGLGEVNHHTLSDFRVEHPAELRKLLSDLLGLLSQEGFVTLECVAHDGTKIRAQAGADTFRREKTLKGEIERAQQMVEELDKEGEAAERTGDARRQAARRRVAEQRKATLKRAAEELAKIQVTQKNMEEKAGARVSLTEPEARRMKHGDNAFAPSYNVQMSTDAAHSIVVAVALTQCGSDGESLLPSMEKVKEIAGQYPEQVVADGGFTNQQSIAGMQEKGMDFYGSLPELEVKQRAAMKSQGIDPEFSPAAFQIITERQSLKCPDGKMLEYVRPSKKDGNAYHQYQAQSSDCAACQFRKRCCPNHADQGRTVSIRISEKALIAEFRAKMHTDAAKRIYRKRGATAEFPFSWIKEKLGIRKFRLRGLAKATSEALWGVLTYDALQWERLSWRPKIAKAA